MDLLPVSTASGVPPPCVCPQGFGSDVALLRKSLAAVGRRFLGANLEGVAQMGGLLAAVAHAGQEEIRSLEDLDHIKDLYALKAALEQLDERARIPVSVVPTPP